MCFSSAYQAKFSQEEMKAMVDDLIERLKSAHKYE
jgi:hypothetical protein